jgi:acetyl esterase/lipase
MKPALLLSLLLLAAQAPAAEPRVLRDVPYAEPPHERQTLDIYAPPEAEARPIVFWIHGGGWQRGDKREVDHKPQAFVEPRRVRGGRLSRARAPDNEARNGYNMT